MESTVVVAGPGGRTGRLLLTCSSSRSAGSAWVGTSSVSISDITLTFPLTISSSLRSFPIWNTRLAPLREAGVWSLCHSWDTA